MLDIRSRRRLLAAFAGAFMLAGFGTTGAALAAEFRAVLNGDNELAAGDPDGWGRVRIRIDDTLNTMCTDFEVRSIGHVRSAQIYRGRPGEDGDAVVDINRPHGAGDNDSVDCDDIGDTLADEIQSNPTNFYVNVMTDDFPGGAIRGQFGPSGS
jgi:hypothetical protein